MQDIQSSKSLFKQQQSQAAILHLQTGNTHIDFKVFGGGVDAAGGGVVARQVVQGHMSYRDGVRQRDHKGPLDTVKRPTFPWEQHREALGRKEQTLLLLSGQKLWIIIFLLTNNERESEGNGSRGRRKDRRRDGNIICLQKIEESGR